MDIVDSRDLPITDPDEIKVEWKEEPRPERKEQLAVIDKRPSWSVFDFVLIALFGLVVGFVGWKLFRRGTHRLLMDPIEFFKTLDVEPPPELADVSNSLLRTLPLSS